MKTTPEKPVHESQMLHAQNGEASNEKEDPQEAWGQQVRQLSKPLLRLTAIIAVLFSVYQLYSAGIESLPAMQHRAIHLSFALVLVFFLYPTTRKDRTKVPWWDWLCIAGSVAIGAYIVVNYMELVYRQGNPNTWDLIMSALAILLCLEASRRTMGWTLTLVAGAFLLYAMFGQYIPGTFGHNGYSIKRILEQMYFTSEGIYGVAIYTTASFVFTFIVFGAMLEASGGGKAFIDLAFALTGRFRGGPAKAAVIGSGLMGTISGSSFANVASTGVFTIPLMKSVGYRPAFAGGVEAAASSGGQIMPPVMGAAAFIMAEMTGIPYNQIIIHAMLPAILYYFSIFLMVDYQAAKSGLKGLPKEQLPDLKATLKKSIFLLAGPVGILVMLLIGYTPIKAAFYGVIIVFVASLFRKDTRLTLPKLLQALENGAKGAIGLIAASAVAGIIVGVVTLTGVGLKFSDFVLQFANNNLYLALFLTMIASIILGMGLPTAALYIILGTLAAPALVKMGVPVAAAHLFIFYFGCMAAVTPPVALSSYLAATIAKAQPMRTALHGFKLSLAAFLLPFIFAVNPAILFIDTTIGEFIWITITAIIGIFALASSLEGYVFRKISWFHQIVLFLCALLMLDPGTVTDFIGVIGIVLLAIYHYWKKRQEDARALTA